MKAPDIKLERELSPFVDKMLDQLLYDDDILTKHTIQKIRPAIQDYFLNKIRKWQQESHYIKSLKTTTKKQSTTIRVLKEKLKDLKGEIKGKFGTGEERTDNLIHFLQEEVLTLQNKNRTHSRIISDLETRIEELERTKEYLQEENNDLEKKIDRLNEQSIRDEARWSCGKCGESIDLDWEQEIKLTCLKCHNKKQGDGGRDSCL